MADGTTAPKGALIAALICIALGLASCGFAGVTTVPYVRDLADFVSDVGGSFSSEPMGESLTVTAGGPDGIVLMSTEAECTGDGGGKPVSFEEYNAFGTGASVDLGGVDMAGYRLFDTDEGETYTISCGPGLDGRFVAATAPNFLIDGAGSFVFGIAAAFAGAFLFVIGIVLLIVALVQRSGWRKRNQGPPQSPQHPLPGGGFPQPPPSNVPPSNVPPSANPPMGQPQVPPTYQQPPGTGGFPPPPPPPGAS